MEIKILDGRSYFWQWDLNQLLEITGGECPAVDFEDNTGPDLPTKTVTTRTDIIPGKTVCFVPNSLLEGTEAVVCYPMRYTTVNADVDHNGVAGSPGDLTRATEFMKSFRIRERPKPNPYTPPEGQELTWETVMATAQWSAQTSENWAGQAQDHMKAAGTSEQNAKTSEDNALQHKKDAEAAAVQTGNDLTAVTQTASRALTDIGSAKSNAVNAVASQQSASVQAVKNQETASLSAVSAKEEASNQAITEHTAGIFSEVESTRVNAVASVNATKEAGVTAVQQAQSTATGAVKTQETSSVGNVQSAETKAVASVNKTGADAVGKIQGNVDAAASSEYMAGLSETAAKNAQVAAEKAVEEAKGLTASSKYLPMIIEGKLCGIEFKVQNGRVYVITHEITPEPGPVPATEV